MDLVTETIRQYRRCYGKDPILVVTAPGRVNLIGEHTDYNDGFVLPVAIDRHICIASAPRNDHIIKLHSVDFQSSVTVPLSNLTPNDQIRWVDYPKGVADQFLKRGYSLTGANFCIKGNIPIAAGLSSSAALEVASAITFRQLHQLQIGNLDLIKLAEKAEMEFVGVNCGIMDQLICVLGKKDHALFLDCKTLEYRYVPFPEGIDLVICDTGIRRELARSAYNKRREECVEAVRQLTTYRHGLTSLRDISSEEFEKVQQKLSPILRRRVLHVISENERVLRTSEAMKKNDVELLGKLMIDSHMSLRNNYEVSSKELDTIVDIAVETAGVFGARMTGAGFGGCAICIVAKEKTEELVERLNTEYPNRTSHSFAVFLTKPANGSAVVKPQESLTPITVANLFS
ncbi:MAG: galactokinase [Ignavibacteriae bacterium]|nr:galactokinase [Ignavibacteriota bacterium]